RAGWRRPRTGASRGPRAAWSPGRPAASSGPCAYGTMPQPAGGNHCCNLNFRNLQCPVIETPGPGGSAELGHHPFGEEGHRREVGVVVAPRDEVGAAELDVAGDLLRHLVGGADEVAGRPGVELLTPDRPGPAGGDEFPDLRFALPDQQVGAPRLADLLLVAADRLAVLLQHFPLGRPLLGLAAEVRPVGQPGDHAQGQLLAGPAD